MMPFGKDIEVLSYNGQGYSPLMHFGAWRVAVLNSGPRTTAEGIPYLQKHNETDEVFILSVGRCTLIVAGSGDIPGAPQFISMEHGNVYNIRRGIWHSHVLAEGSSVWIVENEDTSAENSPTAPVTRELRDRIALACGEPGQNG